ncbi:hypothetical protein F5X68DRAFT_238233 [Plectosphaerella plurivora]|uniref:F-box domain-containing protein n=1 Tax=Plectosphaerella plurivora TaxID=936078 RepID=A0A9P8VNW6_9PEZI|nr:hypothetical protein F5X68DRAFT_238233 [Plectosphaerella plurivora]
MRFAIPLGLFVAQAFAAAIADPDPTPVLHARQSVVTPPPCQPISPPPTERETEQRFDEFANAFLRTKNLTNAFEYISSTYINHNPFAEDGPNAALDVLGPVWPNIDITVLRTAFRGDQGWLNYNFTGGGEVVDRFRWEAGCIVEHWDAGEVFPEGVLEPWTKPWPRPAQRTLKTFYNITKFPDEIIIVIGDNTRIDNLLNFVRVCHRFHELMQGCIWRAVRYRLYGYPMFPRRRPGLDPAYGELAP